MAEDEKIIPAHVWFGLLAMVVGAFVAAYATILLIKVYLTKVHLTLTPTNDGPTRNKIFLLGILVNIILTVAITFGAISQIVFLADEKNNSLTDDYLSFLSLTAYFISQSMTVFLFIYQIEFTFKATHLLSARMIKILLMCAYILIGSWILASIMFTTADVVKNGDGLSLAGLVFFGIWVLLYFCLLVVLLYIANTKVKIVINDTNNELRENTGRLIAGYTVLVNVTVVAVITAVIFYIFTSVAYTVEGLDDSGLVFLAINANVQALIVKLMMESQLARKDIFYKKWCGSCDKSKRKKLGLDVESESNEPTA